MNVVREQDERFLSRIGGKHLRDEVQESLSEFYNFSSPRQIVFPIRFGVILVVRRWIADLLEPFLCRRDELL